MNDVSGSTCAELSFSVCKCQVYCVQTVVHTPLPQSGGFSSNDFFWTFLSAACSMYSGSLNTVIFRLVLCCLSAFGPFWMHHSCLVICWWTYGPVPVVLSLSFWPQSRSLCLLPLWWMFSPLPPVEPSSASGYTSCSLQPPGLLIRHFPGVRHSLPTAWEYSF